MIAFGCPSRPAGVGKVWIQWKFVSSRCFIYLFWGSVTLSTYMHRHYNKGVNISERKSGTERTKKRKKRQFVFFSPPGGATGTVVHRLDATPILPELRKPGICLTRALRGTNRPNPTKLYNFAERINFAEHGKLVAESSEFHLTLSRAHRVHFFQLEIRRKSGTF